MIIAIAYITGSIEWHSLKVSALCTWLSNILLE
jgi:hypothetical protein